MYIKFAFVFAFLVEVRNAFLYNEPCNRTIKSAEIDFVIGKGCRHGMISILPSASGSLSAYFFNKIPEKCVNTVCLRSCNTVPSFIFALPQDPFRCCNTFPRPKIDIRDSADETSDSRLRYKTSKYGEDWLCTWPHTQQQIVVNINISTLYCAVKVEYLVDAVC